MSEPWDRREIEAWIVEGCARPAVDAITLRVTHHGEGSGGTTYKEWRWERNPAPTAEDMVP